jgi:hypothetical protein
MTTRFILSISSLSLIALVGCNKTPSPTNPQTVVSSEVSTISKPDTTKTDSKTKEKADQQAKFQSIKDKITFELKTEYGLNPISFELPSSFLISSGERTRYSYVVFQDSKGKAYFVDSTIDDKIINVYQIGEVTTFKATPVTKVSGESSKYGGYTNSTVSFSLQPESDVIVFANNFVFHNSKGVRESYTDLTRSHYAIKVVKKLIK